MPRVIAIRREDLEKVGERRSAIAPAEAELLTSTGARVLVQPSRHPETGESKRAFDDVEFERVGCEITEDLSEATVVFGLKEIDLDALEADRAYLFFSHTHKGQLKNRPLLEALVQRRISLIDYEHIADNLGRRLLRAFGSFAGRAGMTDTLWTLGRRLASEGFENPFAAIPQSIASGGLADVKSTLDEVGSRIEADGTPEDLPPVVVCVLGRGVTSAGALEMLDHLPTQDVTIGELADRVKSGSRRRIHKLVLEVDEMYRISTAYPEQAAEFGDMAPASRFQYYIDNPRLFESNMDAVLPHITALVNCIIWSPEYPRTVTADLMHSVWTSGTPLKVIGDVTCDPNGSIEFSRETWIDDPVFTYRPDAKVMIPGLSNDGVNVMAVTNLPCEFSRDASIDFSADLRPLLPSLVAADLVGELDDSELAPELENAVVLWHGKLTPRFAYMSEFLPA